MWHVLLRQGSRGLVAQWITFYPGATILVMPLARVGGLDPPAALVVLHHQLLKPGAELFGAYGPSVELAFQFCVTAVSFFEIYLTLPKVYASSITCVTLTLTLHG